VRGHAVAQAREMREQQELKAARIAMDGEVT
jgi:hypothetical protein